MAAQHEVETTGRGFYAIPFAARLAHMDQQTIRRWLFGYQRGGVAYPPATQTHLPEYDGKKAASFLDVMELRVIRQFLELGVSLQMVRKVELKARQLLRTDYPFSTRLFKTDGRTIFADFKAEATERLLEVISDQWVFEEVVGPSLHDLDYPDAKQTTSPHLWWPAGRDSQIVVNPRVSFGMPVVRDGWVPTRILANQARVNDVESVSELYEVTQEAVAEALEFEDQLAA